MSTENNPVPENAEGQDVLIADHRYDGIREYDNPMPFWWSAIFWATIVFSLVYYVGFFFMDFVDDYQDDLNQSMSDLEAVRAAWEKEHPQITIDEASLAAVADDPSKVEEGKALFVAQCAACHGPEGQGLIGPNMTDQYWIHGGTNVDIYNTITNGVLDKGMPPWEAVYTVDQRASLVAFIRSIQGTNPAGAKEPQGDLVEPTS
ncbi:MAG: c-type cytochrome [Bacteroidetes bacterium]|nr:c-type cytochrome [Bacteroidota bacterium]